MDLLKVLPELSEAKIAPKGKLNAEDLKKMGRNMLIFLTPTFMLYGGQLIGAINDHTVLSLTDLVPSAFVVGAFEGYLISTLLDYLKKLNDGPKLN